MPQTEYLYVQANDIAQDAKQIELAGSVRRFAQQLAADDPLKPLLLHNTDKQKGLLQQSFKGPLQLMPIYR